MNKVAIIIAYFGKWPDWIDLFFFSCVKNQTIDFIIFTDCEIKNINDKNIKFFPISFSEHSKFISNKLNINFKPRNPYKLCDVRPFLGYLHNDLLNGYDFYGFGDIDIVYGDIRSFISDEILNKYDVISTHEDRISGHFTLFRNIEKNINSGFKIKNWKEKLHKEMNVRMNENYHTRIYFPMFIFNVYIKKLLRRFIGLENVIWINNLINMYYKKTYNYKKRKLFFTEQYTTPFTYIYWIDGSLHQDQPDTWYYKNGYITNSRDIGKKFIYLHFMNFKSGKYRKDKKALWGKNFYNIEKSEIENGVCINTQGIFPLNKMEKVKCSF